MIEINNLYFSYGKSLPYVLDNINLKVETGRYISVLGENGSGKSTLMKLILNLLKPTSGSIKIGTKNLGYVPQFIENFNSAFPITVEEMLRCHKSALKLKDNKIISKSLTAVGMEDFDHNLIGNLSGGQRQKIFIARAIMGCPELILLDEPSSGIDIKSQKEIYNILKTLNKNNGITILSVEHNIKAATENSTDIFKIDKGKGTLLTINDFLQNNAEVFHNVTSFTS